MKARVLEGIRYEPDVNRLFALLRVEEESDDGETLEDLVAEAASLARPTALYGEAYIESKGDDTVVIDGVTFTSRVLRVNLEAAHRVFPYVATCGTELEGWAKGLSDMLCRYWADGIMQMALSQAIAGVNRRIAAEFVPGRTAVMNPGSLPDWPIEEQRPLFALLGDPQASIGVTLTESLLMIPAKSVSGVHFPAQYNYENCQLCPREVCSGRRAPYDKELYDKRFRRTGP
jgi:hypothetical protein